MSHTISSKKHLTRINKLLMKHTPSLNDCGLLNGKMGVAIYFFHSSQQRNNIIHRKFAENLVDEVIQHMGNSTIPLNFENGMAGIVWGIEHLMRNGFIGFNDDIFSAIDDIIFQYIVDVKEMSLNPSSYAGYLLYLVSRTKNPYNTSIRYHKRLIIELVNKLYYNLNRSNLQEPIMFDLLWYLPLILFVLGEVYTTNIFNDKIHWIIKELSCIVLSMFPYMHCNRLLLYFGITSVLKHIDIPLWKVHAFKLKKEISMHHILNVEMKNKAIIVRNGVSGISLINDYLFHNHEIDEIIFRTSSKECEQRILTSDFWEQKHISCMGILNGYAGIGLSLLNKIS